jgi:regulator of cell morphogenesis and NO signaling
VTAVELKSEKCAWSFTDLLQLHTKLDQLFVTHQRALLRLDLKSALAALELFEMKLLAHMQDEEELLIPLYDERAEVPVGGTAGIFLGEHEKMRQYLVLFKEEMSRMAASEDLEREVIWLLDSQHIFKRLLVHHDTREKKMLYPLLDQVTTDEEREGLFALMKSRPTD